VTDLVRSVRGSVRRGGGRFDHGASLCRKSRARASKTVQAG
jgi:hypothetical protein